MNGKPREVLKDMVARYGTAICEDRIRCLGYLRDMCGTYKGEISVLLAAFDEDLPSMLLTQSKTTSTAILIGRLAKRLYENRMITEEASHWAVESWALALGVISSKDVSEVKISSTNRSTDEPPPIETFFESFEPPPIENDEEVLKFNTFTGGSQCGIAPSSIENEDRTIEPPPISEISESTGPQSHNWNINNFSLALNEQILFDSKINLYEGAFNQTIGNLKVTNLRILFIVTNFDTERVMIDIPFDGIKEVNGVKLLGISPTGISILTKSGKEYKLVADLWKRKQLLNLLQGLCKSNI